MRSFYVLYYYGGSGQYRINTSVQYGGFLPGYTIYLLFDPAGRGVGILSKVVCRVANSPRSPALSWGGSFFFLSSILSSKSQSRHIFHGWGHCYNTNAGTSMMMLLADYYLRCVSCRLQGRDRHTRSIYRKISRVCWRVDCRSRCLSVGSCLSV